MPCWRLIGVCAIVVPRSLLPSTFLATVPLAAFLAIAAIGETLVLMSRGIDLSTPAVITLSSTLILGVSQGHDGDVWLAVLGSVVERRGDRAVERRCWSRCWNSMR